MDRRDRRIGNAVISVRIPCVALVGLGLLSGCVGTDGQSKLNAAAGSPAAVAPVAIETPAIDAIEPAPNVAGVMPGDLLVAPSREAAATNPYAVLERPTKVARAAPSRRLALAERSPQPAPMASATQPEPSSSQSSTFAMAPLMNPRRAPNIGSADSTGTGLALRSKMAPLGEIEAQAAVEQRAQDERNRHFDAQVRRASGLVCDGCVSSPQRRSSRPRRAGDDAEE